LVDNVLRDRNESSSRVGLSVNLFGERLMEIMERKGIVDLDELVDRLNEARVRFGYPTPEITTERLALLMTTPPREQPDLRVSFFLLLEQALGTSRDSTLDVMIALSYALHGDQG
jgi:hypothetical protein